MNYKKTHIFISKIFKNLIILSLVLIVGCSTDKSDDGKAISDTKPAVVTSEVKGVEYSDTIRATGRLTFNNEYKMSFKTSGIIESIFVKEGQYVKKGKLLASLKLDEIASKANQAEIALTKIKRDYKRTSALHSDRVATLEQLQNVETQLKNGEMNLKTARFNLKHSKIIAPANGIIQKILLKENEITGAGNPVVFFGAENQGKVLNANISDVDVVKIQIGDKASLHFDAWEETVFDGKLIEIAGMASPATGTYVIKIQVNDTGNQLKPGFIGNAVITSSKVNQWIEIPIEALVQADKKTGVVYKVKNELAIRQDVHVARILNEKLLISKGLNNGDKIIVEGLDKLTGDSISVKSIK